MRAALLFLTVAAPTASLHVTDTSLAVIHDAMQRLESLWPGGKGAEILTAITHAPRFPPRDEGHALGSRLRKKFESRDTFVFAAFGSSVTAGHDNVANQSWPYELERILKPTFRAMGFDFEMRQRGMGGFGEMPFAAGCLHTRAGDRVDALSWEWHMFNDPPCAGHHFLSEAGAMPSHPMVFAFGDSSIEFEYNLLFEDHIDNGDYWKQNKVERRKPFFRNGDETMGPTRDWKPNEWYLTDEYISQEETARWQREAAVKVRPELVGQMNSEMTWLHRTGAAPEFERQGHAFYPISVSAATKYVIDDPWYQVREKAFNINWHPGPLGHTLIASAMAHFMLASLKTALTPYGPSLNNERTGGPTADNPLVGAPIVGKLETPQCGHLRPRKCNSGVQPTTPGTGLHVDPSSPNTWQYVNSMQLSGVTVGHLDAVDKRLTYHGTKQDGEIRFRFRAKRNNQIVMLCGAPCGWRCAGNFGYVSTKSQIWWDEKAESSGLPRKNVSDLTYTIDGQAVPGSNLLSLHDEFFSENGKFCPKCTQVADVCQPVAEVSQGDHTVGARVEARSRADPDAMGNPMVVEILTLMVVG